MAQVSWKKTANIFWTAVIVFGLVGLVALFYYSGAFGRM
jgi:hypothetical protein